MKILEKINTTILLITIALVFPFLESCAQTDDLSKGEYRKTYLTKAWQKLDTNKDGQFTESENERSWKRLKKLDKNKDSQVSFEEFLQKNIPYLNTGGKRKLNVLYKVTKEQNLYLDIYYPKEIKEGEKLPVVILEKGFCVVSVGYRLWKKGGEVTMRDCVIDSKDALRYLSKHSKKLGIDTNRFFSFGDSAGGHIAQMLLLSAPETLKGDPDLAEYTYKMVAGLSWYGPCDFEKTSLFNHDDRANFKDRFGPRIVRPDTKPEEKLSLYKEMSPINYLEKNSPPLLMIQGDKDTTIPVKHAYYMAKKAEEIGAPVKTLIVKNAGHNWRKVEEDIVPTREEIITTTVDYFVAHLK